MAGAASSRARAAQPDAINGAWLVPLYVISPIFPVVFRTDAAPRPTSKAVFAGAALTAAAVPLAVYGIDGGAYDIVPRQTLGIVVWSVLALGWASGVLPRTRIPVPMRVAVLGLLGLCLLCALSLVWTESPERTIEDLARDAHYLGIVLLVASVADRRTAPWILGGCFVAAIVVLGLAMASRLVPSAFPSNETGRIFETSRLAYPLNYWNALGALAAMTVAMAAALSAHLPSRRLRAAALAVTPLAAAVVFLTYSRAAVIGTAVAVILVVGLARHRLTTLTHVAVAGVSSALVLVVIRHHREIADAKGSAGAWAAGAVLVAAMAACALAATLSTKLDAVRVPRNVGRPLLGSAAVAACAVLLIVGPGYASDAWDEFTRPSTLSSYDPVARLSTLSGYRYEIFRSDWEAFTAHPLTGTGSGTFEFWFNRTGGAPALRDGHSLFLEPLAELGVGGLIAVLVALGGLAAGCMLAVRRERHPSAAAVVIAGSAAFLVFCVQAGVDWLWECTAVTAIALVASVAVSGIGAQRGQQLATRWRLGGVLVALAAVGLQIPGMVSIREQRASERAAARGDMSAALARANAAVGAAPWSSSAQARRALVLEARGDVAGALPSLTRAAELEPTNWRWPLLRARVHAQLGHPAQAIDDLREAKRLRPESKFLAR